jgi:hypothetical protein
LEQYEGKIKFLAGAEDVVKNAMFVNMGRLFRKWKSELNTNYVKKSLAPKYMGKIIEAQWKKFVQQKADPKALAISNEYAEMSKKNIYPHHMGSSRYVAKIPKWKKKIEEAVSEGNPNPVEDIEDRTVNWLLARLKLTKTANLPTRRKELPQFKERQYNSLKTKD